MRRLWLTSGLLTAVLAVGLVFGWPAGGFAAATGWVGDNHAAARLITATEATGSASAIEAGLEIRLAPGWHTYWRSPGDAGIPPSIDWAGLGQSGTRRDRLAGAAALVVARVRDRRVREPCRPADHADPGAAGAPGGAARRGRLCRLRQYLRAVFDKIGAEPARGRSDPGAPGGVDRRGSRPGPAKPRRRRDRADLGRRRRRRPGRVPGRSAARDRRGFSDARPVCRRPGQRFARPAGGGTFPIRSYRAPDRADPRRGRRRHCRHKS